MYRDKTIIRCRKDLHPKAVKNSWDIKRGKYSYYGTIGISRLLRLIATLVQDKGAVYSIDIIIKRKH